MNDTSAQIMLMDSYFDFLYARALYNCLAPTVKQNCYGCEVDHPSQLQHYCLMYDVEEHIYMYFDDMMAAVDEDNILLSWSEIVDTLDVPPELLAMHKLKIYDKDWLATMKTDQWKTKHRKMLLSITRIERRF